MDTHEVVQIVAMNRAIERLSDSCFAVPMCGEMVRRKCVCAWYRKLVRICFEGGEEPLTFCFCTSELSSSEVDQVSYPDNPNYSNIGHIVCGVNVSVESMFLRGIVAKL